MSGYDPKNKPVHELAERLIQNDVLLCVTSIVERLLETDFAETNSFTDDYYDALGNAAESCGECRYCEEGYEESCEDPQYPEVFEWWAVSKYLARELRERNEVILDNCYGVTVWGRTVTGQSILLDGTMQEIAEALIERTQS